MIRSILKGVWQFCAYLFVPRWGKRNSSDRIARQETKKINPTENRRGRWLI